MFAPIRFQAQRVAFVGGLIFVAAAQAAPAPWRYSGNAGAGYDSNPANIRSSDIEQPAGFVTAAIFGERQAILSPQSALLLRLSLNGEGYARHERLSHARAGSLLRLSLRAGSDFYAPLLAFWGSAAYAEFGSRIRDGAEYRGGLFVQEQLTTKMRTRFGVQWSRRSASGSAFEGAGHSGTWDLDWSLSGPASAYFGYQYYDGNLVSTNVLRPAAILAASAIDSDDAFGGASANQFAFRLRSHAHLGTLGFNYALSPAYSLDAQLQSILASANTGSRYRRSFSVVSLLFKF